MASYGYARVSTLDQDLTIQRAALKAAGCRVVRAEKTSGSRRDGRAELLDFAQPGDILVVTRIDRLARSMKDLQDIVHEARCGILEPSRHSCCDFLNRQDYSARPQSNYLVITAPGSRNEVHPTTEAVGGLAD